MKNKYLLVFFAFVATCYLQISHAATFTYQATMTVNELNKVLQQERVEFLKASPPLKSYRLPKVTSAKYDVDLYKVEYESVIPEQGNRPTTAYGLVAIPKSGISALPFMTYQHGTVFGKHEVPSYAFLPDDSDRYKNSYETRLAVAQFAGNGYIVISADYFGMGDSIEPEGYLVKASHQQACLDLYLAAKEWLASEKSIIQTQLFLSGWSQGGYVTMAFLEKLEEIGLPVDAASTAAAPTDLFASFNSVIYHPREADAVWLSTIFSLSSYAFENYYQEPGLVEELFKPEYVDKIHSIYYRTYSSAAELGGLIMSLSRYDQTKNMNVADIAMLLKDEYEDPAVFAVSRFGKIALQSDVYRWHFKTPVDMYYGLADEAVAPRVATVAAMYQKTIGNNNVIKAKPVSGANHRATYLTASSKQFRWFNSLTKAKSKSKAIRR